MITCKEIMTKSVVCSKTDEHVTDVAQKMDVAKVGSIPIVKDMESRELLGIITDRDIVVRVVAPNINAHTSFVHEVMSQVVFTCKPEDNVETAIARMAEHQIRRLPIVDRDNCVVGIIAQADIARYVDRTTTGTLVGEISEETTKHKLA